MTELVPEAAATNIGSAFGERGAFLSLKATKATLSLRRDAKVYKGKEVDNGSISLNYSVTLDGDTVEIPGKESLQDLAGHVSIRSEGRDPEELGAESIGYFAYIPALEDDIEPQAASYGAEVWLSESQFSDLVHAARNGAIPSHIMIRVTGLTYGWTPDGSAKKWPTVHEKRHERVTEISFAIPVATQPTMESDDELSDEAKSLPPTRGDLLAFKAKVDEILSESKQLAKTVNWILWATAAIVVLLFFAR